MKTRTIIVAALAVCLAFALAGCSSGSGNASSSSSNPTSVSAVETKAPERQDIKTIEAGFAQAGDYWTYAVILENPNEDVVAENIPVSITIKDESGTVLYNTTVYISYLFPLQKTAVAQDVVSLSGTPATIEAVASVRDNAWESADGIQGGDADKIAEVTGLTELDQGYGSFSYTGEVSNSMDDVVTTEIIVVFRDDAGKAIGGTFTYANNVPAGGKAAFQAYAYDPPAHASMEAYAMPAY